MGTSFETFQESEDQEEMEYPIAGLDKLHELWKNALGRTNAFLFQELQALLLAISSAAEAQSPSEVNMSDIDLFFQEEGHVPKLLEFEFEPSTTEAIPYLNKAGRQSYSWYWTHKLTGQPVKRFSSVSGKSFDTGTLTKFLHCLKKTPHSVAYAPAQYILLLNKSIQEQVNNNILVVLDRKTLLAQQVRLFPTLELSDLPTPHCITHPLIAHRSKLYYLLLNPTCLRWLCKGQWQSGSFNNWTHYTSHHRIFHSCALSDYLIWLFIKSTND
jgi:hypothetical protein